MKILHISLGKHQTSQTKALQSVASEFRQIDWTDNPARLNESIAALNFKPDVTFMQLQRQGLITPQTIESLGGKVYNWTGDVRTPIEAWYKQLAPYVTATLFSNNTDVLEFKRLGLRAEFLNIGFEEKDYYTNGEKIDCGVVFMGNNYGTQFPLSRFRHEMVNSNPAIQVFGNGWGKYEDLNGNPLKEAALYRGCKIAINLSHFDYDRYSSDRMLRIMACGAFCLSHHYQGIEKDFEVGVDLDTWKTYAELNDKIGYYLANPLIARQLAENGCKKVWDKHKWSDRINELLTNY